MNTVFVLLVIEADGGVRCETIIGIYTTLKKANTVKQTMVGLCFGKSDLIIEEHWIDAGCVRSSIVLRNPTSENTG